METDYARIWRFEDAPEELQTLSAFGGDEDWVIFVPKQLLVGDDWWAWWPTLAERLAVGPEPQQIQTPDGLVFITAHA